MKKAITAVTAIFIMGFFTVSAYAWGGGCGAGGRMNGNGYNNQAAANQGDYASFYKDTQALRVSISGDRAELNALMAGPNPDPKKARTLAENITKTQAQIRAKALEYNVSGPMSGGRGNGHGKGNCPGQYRNQSARCW